MDSNYILQILQLYGLRVVGAIITLIVGYLIAGWLKRWVKKVSYASEKIDNTVGSLFAQIAFITLNLGCGEIVILIFRTINSLGLSL